MILCDNLGIRKLINLNKFMAKWQITTQKSNIPALSGSSVFNDFSLIWDTDNTSAFLTTFKSVFKSTVDAADADKYEKKELLEKIEGLQSASDIEKLKDKNWITWVKKDD